MTVTLILSLLLAAYLLYRNYQLEKRWRCLRYCWISMSDLAAARLMEDDGEDEQWLAAMREQAALMARFGVPRLSSDGIRDYEMALLERGLPVLTEHRA